MTREDRRLDELIEALLDDEQYRDHPVREALARLWHQSRDQLSRLERISRISDGFQTLAREKELSLTERYNKQLRQLEKIARISDRYQQMMRDLNLALKEASTRDTLTGLVNRRLLMDRLKEETERANRNGQLYALAMLDVDHFKQINDTHGHETGDRVLIEIGRAMQAELREYDVCGRWGGEEFLIILPDTGLPAAQMVLDRVRDGIRALTVRIGTEVVSITASAGLTKFHAGESFSDTVNRADAALLRAKRNGRDRLIVV